MPRDRSPSLPETVQVTYSCLPCGSATWGTVPLAFSQTANLASAGLNISEQGYPGTLTILDTCPAVFETTTATTPANSSTLQTLTDQIGSDFWAWRETAFDLNHAGIIAPILDASVDEIRWSFSRDRCETRLKSAPWDSHVEQMNHCDFADTCVVRLPVYLSSPSLTFSSGVLTMTKGKVYIQNGILKWYPSGTDSVTVCPS